MDFCRVQYFPVDFLHLYKLITRATRAQINRQLNKQLNRQTAAG